MAAPPWLPGDPIRLVATLREAAIEWALATHVWAEEYDPIQGNREMQRLSGEHPTLRTCACVVPPTRPDEPLPSELDGYLADLGASAARICPRSHGFQPLGRVIADALGAIAASGRPLFVDLSEVAWGDLDAILDDHPSLNVVVERVDYRQDRTLYPLLADHPGLHVETSLYVGHLALESVTNRFSCSRLVFGTGLPAQCPGGPIARVLLADLPDEDKLAIASGNLERLTSRGGVGEA